MIICPNLKNPDVAREFNELIQATSELAAYHIWSLNNGNAIDRAPNGASSKLFLSLLDYYGGDKIKAIQAKAKTYSKSFLNWFGDWIEDSKNSSKVVDENGEPLVVYHGSPKEFTRFSKDFLGTNTGAKSAKLGFFFSNDFVVSRSYVGDVGFVLDDLGLLDVYTPELETLQNERYFELSDLELEYDNYYITKEEYDTGVKRVNKFYDNAEKKIFEKLKANNNKVKACFLNIKNIKSFTGTNAQNIAENISTAISNDADGVVLKNVKDPIEADDYVVFDPNQIKSVDNQGTFSTTNNNVYEGDYKELIDLRLFTTSSILKLLGTDLMEQCK